VTLLANSPLVLDGGLATELEARGHDLSDDLWSARLLRDAPAEIEEVHLAYYRAGASVAITASYQASFEGFARVGIDRDEAVALMRRSVELAMEARRRRLEELALEAPGGRLPELLIAASVGPYGAMLADGQEYAGNYGLTLEELRAFHRPRLEELVAAGPDLLAFETIPSTLEARALVSLLADFPGIPAWLSYSCAEGARTCEGQPFGEAVRVAEGSPQVVAVGLNCTPPGLVTDLLTRARRATSLPFVVYPNDGRVWDGPGRRWLGFGAEGFPPGAIERWRTLGAELIGGCCGIGPDAIRGLAAQLS
jgi:homocysteine S-methyltransferase